LQAPNDVVPAVILGARNARHVDDHRALFSFALDEQDLGLIRDVLDRGKKPKEDCYQWERGGGW
jgi:aryl-alcohol dehydrogenase-like predicted oxidoreductase